MEKKITLWMGEEAESYKEKLKIIGEKLLATGIDVKDNRHGTISLSAVVRYLVDEKMRDHLKKTDN